MTTYAIMAAIPCAANAFGLFVLNDIERDRFFVFAAADYVYFATQLALASALIPLGGFWLVWKVRGVRQWAALLPPVGWPVSERLLVPVTTSLGALAVVNHLFSNTRYTSALQSLAAMVPIMAVFVLARAAAARRARGAFVCALSLAFAESLRAFLFSYLRSPIAYPYLALAVGTWFGSGRVSRVFRAGMLPAYAAALIYVLNYGVLGATRENAPHGLARLSFIANYKADLDARDAHVKQTFASRVANFNQLSQVGRIVAEDGFYNGGTLSYLTFAFVPRVIWPNKPRIERGSWFAVRIGEGRATDDGWYNNTINMTQAGELYINFGWPGVVIGLLLYGALFAILWTTAGMEDPRNALGGAWGFFLIYATLGQYGDLTIVVTLLAMYIVFASITVARQGLSVAH